MLVYATHKGGRYLPIAESLQEQPEGKRNLYVNITNECNCACTFCLRNMKKMAEESSLWLKKRPTVEELKAALDAADGVIKELRNRIEEARQVVDGVADEVNHATEGILDDGREAGEVV